MKTTRRSPLHPEALIAEEIEIGNHITFLLYNKESDQPANVDWYSLSSIVVTEITDDEIIGQIEGGTSLLRHNITEFGLKPLTDGSWTTEHCVVPIQVAHDLSKAWWAKHRQYAEINRGPARPIVDPLNSPALSSGQLIP